jgi:hypothetical protein
MSKKNQAVESVTVTAPNFQTAEFKIKGVAPYVQLRFSQKVKYQLLEKMATEGKASKGKRNVRDYEEEFLQSMYEGPKKERGIPAAAFRKAMVSACKTVGFKMTLAKLSIFIEADFFDEHDGTPLVKISGKPELAQHAVRNATGVVDIRTRAMWKTWDASLKIRWDADQFNQNDIANLLMRVGMQVGIGEGRPDSKQSTGMGWGLFNL